MPHSKESEADAAQLAALGHKGELNRNFSPLAMLGLAFAILNSWTALAASLSLALPSGGPTSVLWGLISKSKNPMDYEDTCTDIILQLPVFAISASLSPSPNSYPHIPRLEANTTG